MRFEGLISSRFLIDVVFGVVTVAAQAAFLLFGQRASACNVDHLFVRLPSLCLEVCLSFVICLNISLPFIQLLLSEQDTSVFYLNSH